MICGSATLAKASGEEINRQPAGGPGWVWNYGWPITEGTDCYDAEKHDRAGLTKPVAEYEHGTECSVTGGYVYRGRGAAAGLAGYLLLRRLLFGADLGISGQRSDGQWQEAELLDSDAQISSFGETETGEVLMVDYNGTVYRLVSQ